MTDRCEALLVREASAEAALRNALSLVAAEGGQFGVIVVLVRPGCIPDLMWSTIDQADAAMAAIKMQLFAQELIRERMMDEDD